MAEPTNRAYVVQRVMRTVTEGVVISHSAKAAKEKYLEDGFDEVYYDSISEGRGFGKVYRLPDEEVPEHLRALLDGGDEIEHPIRGKRVKVTMFAEMPVVPAARGTVVSVKRRDDRIDIGIKLDEDGRVIRSALDGNWYEKEEDDEAER